LPLKWNREAGIQPESGNIEASIPKSMQRPMFATRPRVFCASLADVFDEEVPIEWLADLLKVVHDTPNLDWLLLTKRPENWFHQLVRLQGMNVQPQSLWEFVNRWLIGQFPANVWMGTSVENQKRADERIPELRKIPARVRFLSVEPMLGPVDFHSPASVAGIHWAIFGGESGPGARPCAIDWIRDGVKQCRAAGVAPFVKQLGSRPMSRPEPPPSYPPRSGKYVDHGDRLDLIDKKGGDMSEWPEDLRVREFPI
jgi:protein gp37